MNSIVYENFSWMIYNILLALISVILARVFYKLKTPFMKIVLFTAWLFFVPNTIYLFTDVLHFMDQINEVDYFGAVVLTMQYVFLFAVGFLTYIYSLYPIEKKLKLPTFAMSGINFLIGFGVLLGRVYRLNSWDIIADTQRVFDTIFEATSSPKIVMLFILLGLFANFTYFLFRKNTVNYVSRIIKKI